MRPPVMQLLFLAAAMMPACLHGQSAASRIGDDDTRFVGVWRGEFDNLPGVEMVITDEDGELHGAILFYFHQRANVNSPYTSTPGLPEPMFDLRLDGDTLRFEVSHRHAHPPGSVHDTPIKFHLKLTAPGRAELGNGSEGSPILQMKRTGY